MSKPKAFSFNFFTHKLKALVVLRFIRLTFHRFLEFETNAHLPVSTHMITGVSKSIQSVLLQHVV